MSITLNGTGTIFTNANADIGIGTSSPNTYGTNIRTVDVEGSAGAGIKFGTGTANAYFGAYYLGGSTNTAYVQTFNASPIVFAINNTEYMRIDTAGNVGVGTSTPVSTAKLNISTPDALYQIVTSGTTKGIRFGTTSTYSFIEGVDKTGVTSYQPLNMGGSILQYTISGTEVMRVDANGNLLVGATAPSSTTARIWNAWDSSTQQGMVFRTSSTTFNGSPVLFYNSSVGISGSISQSASAVAYNTSSDYRLKGNVRPLASGIDTINALNPVAYDWKVDGTKGEGFIAHELQEHIPLAVTGEKDAVDEEGKINPQQVDHSKIVVHLVAAMQEQQKQIEELKNKISILEAK